MRLADFLDELGLLKKEWKITSTGAIRCDNQCPISSLAGQPVRDYWEVASLVGLSEKVMGDIVWASDGFLVDDRKRFIRQELLEVCGLK